MESCAIQTAMSTLAIGWMTDPMEKEHIRMRMVLSTPANGRMMLSMVTVTKFGMMAQNMKVNTSRAANMAKESFPWLMAQSTRVSST